MTSTDPTQTPPTQAPDAGTGAAPSTDTPPPAPAPDPSTSSPAASPADQFAALKTLTQDQRDELRQMLDEADGDAPTPAPADSAVVVPPEQDTQVHEVWRAAVGPDGHQVLVGPDLTDEQGNVIASYPLPDGYKLLPPTPTP